MITAIGSTGMRPALDAIKGGNTRGTAVKAAKTDDTAKAAAPAPVADLVAAGAPIAVDKVESIKKGIANGTYKIDPHAIAAKMIADDLPTRI